MIDIALIDPATIRASPGQFLGPDLFKKYRAAASLAGASFNASMAANVLKIDYLPGLLRHLRENGFTVNLPEDVIRAAHWRADVIDEQRAAVRDRLAHPRAELLWPFQREGVPWLAPRQSAILGDEMRLGKTPQSLLAAPSQSGVIIICPGHLKGMWRKAIPFWRPDLTARLIEKFEWPATGEAVIINFERLPLLPEEMEGVALLKKIETSLEILVGDGAPANLTLIADECHAFKSSKAARTKRFRALARAIRKAGGRTWGLTGTPMPNRPMDLLGVLQTFDLLKESFGSYPRFIEVMRGRQDYWGKWTWGEAKPEAAEMLRRVMLRRLQKDVLPDLPPPSFEDITIELSELPAKARQANDEARSAMTASGVSVEDIIAGRGIDPSVQDSIFRARRLLAEALTPYAIEVLKDYQEAEVPVVMFSAHAAPIEAIGKLKRVGLINADVPAEQRFDVAQDFMDGKYSAVAATIKTAATGFDLSRADHIVFIDEEWTPDWFDQGVSRAIKLDKKRGALVKRFVVPGTVFEDVRAINDAKRVNIKASVDKAAVVTVVDTTAEDLRRIK